MMRIIKWFKEEVLPYIFMAGIVIVVIAVMAGAYWLDKVRFVF